MLLSERIVTQLPLTILWTDERELQAKKERYLDKASIKELLRQTPIMFVVAEVGSNLKWISLDECYQFWKEAVQEHIADSPDKMYLHNFPDGYAYIASEWENEVNQPIILLEKVH